MPAEQSSPVGEDAPCKGREAPGWIELKTSPLHPYGVPLLCEEGNKEFPASPHPTNCPSEITHTEQALRMNIEKPASPAEIIAGIDALAERRMTPCGDGHMVWRFWGRGPSNLVLLHGNFGAWTHWIRNVVALSERFTVIVPDIPGFGDSAEPAKPYNAASLAGVIAEGLLSITDRSVPLDVAGFSFGSAVASEVARVLGPHARTYVLVSAGRNIPSITRIELPPLVKWRTLPTEEERNAAHRRNLEIMMIADPARVDELAVHIQATNAERTRLRSVLIQEAASHRTCTPFLQCRVAAIWADRDGAIGPYINQRPEWLLGHHPQARYGIVSGAGHWCSYEAPEQFNRILPALLEPGSATGRISG